MMATGIIRRIDDLGRIAIPKEIRRRLGITEGSPLEIFVDRTTNSVTFTPYRQNYCDWLEGFITSLKTDDYPSEIIEKLEQIQKEL